MAGSKINKQKTPKTLNNCRSEDAHDDKLVIL